MESDKLKEVRSSPSKSPSPDILRGLDKYANPREGRTAEKESVSPTRSKGLEAIAKEQTQVMEPKGPDLSQSHPLLVDQYNVLLRSRTFQQLNRDVTAHHPIILKDSSHMIDYDASTHTIRVPLLEKGQGRPLSTIRENVLWEMHNASLREPLARLRQKQSDNKNSDPGRLAHPDLVATYRFKKATFALEAEWHEWINIAAHDQRVQDINNDPAMGEGGPHVDRSFGQEFRDSEKGWYHFSNYLEGQLKGHTTGHDPDAKRPDWLGKYVLEVVQEQSPEALKITSRQIQDWREGKTPDIKSYKDSPFEKFDEIFEKAREKADKAMGINRAPLPTLFQFS